MVIEPANVEAAATENPPPTFKFLPTPIPPVNTTEPDAAVLESSAFEKVAIPTNDDVPAIVKFALPLIFLATPNPPELQERHLYMPRIQLHSSMSQFRLH